MDLRSQKVCTCRAPGAAFRPYECHVVGRFGIPKSKDDSLEAPCSRQPFDGDAPKLQRISATVAAISDILRS